MKMEPEARNALRYLSFFIGQISTHCIMSPCTDEEIAGLPFRTHKISCDTGLFQNLSGAVRPLLF